jgi:predicted XRE-type DNA-binding protein
MEIETDEIETKYDIPNYEGQYQITRDGQVWSLKSNKWLSQHLLGNGYKFVGLQDKNTLQIKTILIHRVLAIIFIPNLENKKTVNHIDGNKLNNNIENLEWNTYSENVKHSYDLGLHISIKGDKIHSAKLNKEDVIEIKTMLKHNLYKQKEIAELYGVDSSVISRINTNSQWRWV